MLKKIAVLFIFALLIAACLWYAYYLKDAVDSLTSSLSDVDTALHAGNYEKATLCYGGFQDLWETYAAYLKSLIKHSEVDCIGLEIETLGIYLREEEHSLASAALAEIQFSLQQIQEGIGCSWNNIF